VFKVRSSRSTDLEIRSYGEAAVVSGSAHLAASHAGHDVSGTYAYTHVYVKRDGRWQVVAAHSSRVMPKPLFFVASTLARLFKH
jgi:ketosteroid isomerase-like protein